MEDVVILTSTIINYGGAKHTQSRKIKSIFETKIGQYSVLIFRLSGLNSTIYKSFGDKLA